LYRTPAAAIIPLHTFIAEILRRSKSSFSTLQLALFYLFKFRAAHQRDLDHLMTMRPGSKALEPGQDFDVIFPSPPCPDVSIPRAPPSAPKIASHELSEIFERSLPNCGRRLFLTSLILASKYLQDKNYSNKAWSKISGLPAREINKHEREFLSVIGHGLFISAAKFARWSALLVAHINQAHVLRLSLAAVNPAPVHISHDAILTFDFLPPLAPPSGTQYPLTLIQDVEPEAERAVSPKRTLNAISPRRSFLSHSLVAASNIRDTLPSVARVQSAHEAFSPDNKGLSSPGLGVLNSAHPTQDSNGGTPPLVNNLVNGRPALSGSGGSTELRQQHIFDDVSEASGSLVGSITDGLPAIVVPMLGTARDTPFVGSHQVDSHGDQFQTPIITSSPLSGRVTRTCPDLGYDSAANDSPMLEGMKRPREEVASNESVKRPHLLGGSSSILSLRESQSPEGKNRSSPGRNPTSKLTTHTYGIKVEGNLALIPGATKDLPINAGMHYHSPVRSLLLNEESQVTTTKATDPPPVPPPDPPEIIKNASSATSDLRSPMETDPPPRRTNDSVDSNMRFLWISRPLNTSTNRSNSIGFISSEEGAACALIGQFSGRFPYSIPFPTALCN
jgi:hypothetical protein